MGNFYAYTLLVRFDITGIRDWHYQGKHFRIYISINLFFKFSSHSLRWIRGGQYREVERWREGRNGYNCFPDLREWCQAAAFPTRKGTWYIEVCSWPLLPFRSGLPSWSRNTRERLFRGGNGGVCGTRKRVKPNNRQISVGLKVNRPI